MIHTCSCIFRRCIGVVMAVMALTFTPPTLIVRCRSRCSLSVSSCCSSPPHSSWPFPRPVPCSCSALVALLSPIVDRSSLLSVIVDEDSCLSFSHVSSIVDGDLARFVDFLFFVAEQGACWSAFIERCCFRMISCRTVGLWVTLVERFRCRYFVRP